LNLSEGAAALPRSRDEGPVFAEPWHAEVLAVAYALTAIELFSAPEWAECLGSALEDARRNGEPDTAETYYHSALLALEQLIAERAPEIGTRLEARVEEWRSAYLDTPHGKPVELAGRAQNAVEPVHLAQQGAEASSIESELKIKR
jgi:nitrile hydratase accessory protein